MSKIRILADKVANQIAAGEVVERPASVVKELLENSVDAKASKIEIEFRDGGKSYIRVEDNGHGMTQDQALLSLERHATSKIREAKDLNKIRSFGFRGEALPSISSVSRFTMRSRSASEGDGCEIFVNGGKLIHVKDCGMPRGTRIEVSHLFNSVPGRRKFLKTVVTESTHLMHLAKLYALAHPNIDFSLKEGGRTIFKSPACDSMQERVSEIFGKNFSEALVPIHNDKDGMMLKGLIGKPGQSRSTRKEMIFFVNQRPVDSKTLSYATIEAFHTFVPKGRFPIAILFLEIDPESIDVNVHPSKKEIRFREDFKIRNFLLESVLQKNQDHETKNNSINAPSLKYEYDKDAKKSVPQIDPAALSFHGLREKKDFQHLNPKLSKISGTEKLLFSDEKSDEVEQGGHYQQSELIEEILVGTRSDAFACWRLIDRPQGDLALFSTKEGLVAFHGRAAYERVIFEKFENAVLSENCHPSQNLLMPESLELDAIDSKRLLDDMQELAKIGFQIEEFGRNYFRVQGCPEWLDQESSSSFLIDYLEVSRDRGKSIQIIEILREVMIRKSKIKRGEGRDFSDNEMIALAKQLHQCKNPFSCPGGNPTYFEIPTRDFESRFRRKL
jgi:DNA mismatch repair protein MutL